MTYYLLKKKYPNLSIKGFYNFQSLWLQDNIDDVDISVFVDCDCNIDRFKCIGNHKTINYSDNLNLNAFTTSNDYKEKFPFSTALTVLYLFYSKVEIDAMSDEFIKLLIAIDSGHLGYFKDNGRWKTYHVDWLKKMDMSRVYEVLSNSSFEEFDNLIKSYRLNAKVKYNNQTYKFESDIDYFSLIFDFDIDLFEVFNDDFIFNYSTTYKRKNVKDYQLKDYSKIISLAETYKNQYSITYI